MIQNRLAICAIIESMDSDSPPTCDPDIAKLYGTAPDTGEIAPSDGSRADSP